MKTSQKNNSVIYAIVAFALLSGIIRQTGAAALEPNEILVVANAQMPSSLTVARYYCDKRGIPAANLYNLPLGAELAGTISRDDYQIKLAGPIRAVLDSNHFAGKIRCILTIYGVPYKVTGRAMLTDRLDELKELKLLLEKKNTSQNVSAGDNSGIERLRQDNHLLTRLQSQIDLIEGKETDASVDSELSMVLCGPYELYRWQPNRLHKDADTDDSGTIMVCRLDAPNAEIAIRLVDKAFAAEKTGLKGTAYFDSRGIADSANPNVIRRYDQSLRDLAILTRFRTTLAVKEERTGKLFEPGSCPDAVLYCGWYSLQRYVDAFDFVEGAIGFHIASLEAVDLHEPNSTQWCPAMLKDGVTATIGAVAEPYLQSFPLPKDFFLELFEGRCLVEAYYRTLPFNSWRLILIGDPLYTPFKPNRRTDRL